MQSIEKVKAFLNILDEMIDGKYILADVKISKLVKAINESSELYTFMSECLINFDFQKEYNNAHAKITGGEFTLPQEPTKAVALVYCLISAFNSKYLDLYDFMRENFNTLQYHTEYKEFGRRILTPFKNMVASYFGLLEDGSSLVDFDFNNGYSAPEEEIKEEKPKQKNFVDPRFFTIEKLVKNIMYSIKHDKKIKEDQKEVMLYCLNRTIYALNYQDIELISAIISCFDILTKKVRSIAYDYNDLKLEINSFYDEKQNRTEYNEDELVDKKELEEYMSDASKLYNQKYHD